MENFKAKIKNKNLLEPLEGAHAVATYRIAKSKWDISLFEEIAIGQTLGAWDEKHVGVEILKQRVARILKVNESENHLSAEIAFPWNGWFGELSYLLTLAFGKMSFYEDVQLSSLEFSQECFDTERLSGPKNDISKIRTLCGAEKNQPLLMGILKPNVAMNANQVADLYEECASSGLHLLKDDEIRHDDNFQETIERVELVRKVAETNSLKTLYAVHLHGKPSELAARAKALEEAGATALLLNVWLHGVGSLQEVRKATKLPIMAHPALVGAFGISEARANIHPRVTLAQILRAGGADFTLFPSPYGKLGLEKNVALSIAHEATKPIRNCDTITPVPSAGIKPEFAPTALADFGNDFVLNAGTAIFAGSSTPAHNISLFQKGLYGK